MKLPSIVRLPGNKRFKYKPRHYDEDMEDLNTRVDIIKREMGATVDPNDTTTRSERIRFRRPTGKGNSGSLSRQSLMIRLFIILFLGGNSFLYYQIGWNTDFQLIVFSQIAILYVWYRIDKYQKKKRQSS